MWEKMKQGKGDREWQGGGMIILQRGEKGFSDKKLKVWEWTWRDSREEYSCGGKNTKMLRGNTPGIFEQVFGGSKQGQGW